MSKFIIPIISGMVGIIIPVAGMTITPTRDLMLKLSPQEVMPELPNNDDGNSAIHETKLQEMQVIFEAQQSKINEQEEKIKEFEKQIDATKKEGVQNDLVNQKAIACSEANRIQSEIKDNCGTMPYPGMEKCIESLKERYDDFKDGDWLQSEEANKRDAKKIKKKLEKIESLKPLYLKNSKVCGVEVR